MHIHCWITFILLFHNVYSGVVPSKRPKCATRDFNQAHKIDQFHEYVFKIFFVYTTYFPKRIQKIKKLNQIKLYSNKVRTIIVKVHWHIIQSLTDKTKQAAHDSIIKTIAVLNADFSTSSFEFELLNIVYTPQPLISSLEALAQLKSGLRIGSATTLNVYSGILPSTILGHATFPQDYSTEPLNDGVSVTTGSLASSLFANMLGRTLTHEVNTSIGLFNTKVGHWLGLYHTFNDGCAFPNDFVADTRPQAQETIGCPINIKTCSRDDFDTLDKVRYDEINALKPFDMTENFMDYTDDVCMKSFTKGQIERMNVLWAVREGFE